MELAEVLQRRRMVRNYDPDRPVPPAVVRRLLEHAIRAPSAGFSQGWGFLVLAEPGDRARFWAATSQAEDGAGQAEDGAGQAEDGAGQAEDGAGQAEGEPQARPDGRWLAGMQRAPLIIVVHSHKEAYLDRYAEPDKGWDDRDEARWPVPYWHIDAGMATLLILLTVVDEGLGACFFGIPPDRTAAYRSAFGVPEGMTPIGAVTIGYPAPDWRSPSLKRGRRGVDQVVHRGRWAQLASES